MNVIYKQCIAHARVMDDRAVVLRVLYLYWLPASTRKRSAHLKRRKWKLQWYRSVLGYTSRHIDN